MQSSRLPAIFSQRDPAWARHTLGWVAGSTIGDYGCYVSAHAMVANAGGHQVNPAQMEEAIKAAGLFMQGNLLAASGITLQQVFPDCRLINTLYYTTVPADLGKLEDLIGSGLYVTIELDFDHDLRDGVQSHFGVVESVDAATGTINLADPWYGTVEDMRVHYGPDPAGIIMKYVVYQVPPMVEVPDDVNVDPEPIDVPADDAPDPVYSYLSMHRPMNPSTAIYKRAALALVRDETRGPAISDEYDFTAPDGTVHQRQDFEAGTLDYDPNTTECNWVQINLERPRV